MKAVFIICLLSFNIGYSQEIQDILNSRKFVLEAQKITDNEGLVSQANRRLCFVLLDSTKIIVQWIADCDNNGLGGITMRGKINSFELKKENINKEVQHKLIVQCTMDDGRVESEVIMEIYSKSHADAFINNSTSSIFVPKEMKILGRLSPLHESKVVIGSY